MRFMAICGSGLGSSFMVQMNIETILKELGVKDVELDHADIASAVTNAADVFFVASDVADSIHVDNKVVVLDSIIDMDELRTKVTDTVDELGLR